MEALFVAENVINSVFLSKELVRVSCSRNPLILIAKSEITGQKIVELIQVETKTCDLQNPNKKDLLMDTVDTKQKLPYGMSEYDLSNEEYREYEFEGKSYRIWKPSKLFIRKNGTTHRVLDLDGIVHCLPAPGHFGCVLRWKPKSLSNPIQF